MIGPSSVGTLWSIVATVRSGRRTGRPASRSASNACGLVTSCTRWRSIQSRAGASGACATTWSSQILRKSVLGVMTALCRIRAEEAQLAGLLPQLLQRRPDDVVEDVAVEHCVEAVAPRRVRKRPRDELHQVDAVARKRAQGVVERARAVVGDEGDGGPPGDGRLDLRVRRQRHEARERAGLVADVVLRSRARRCRRPPCSRARAHARRPTPPPPAPRRRWRVTGCSAPANPRADRGTGRAPRGATGRPSPRRGSSRAGPAGNAGSAASPLARSRAAPRRAGRGSPRSGRSASSRSAARRGRPPTSRPLRRLRRSSAGRPSPPRRGRARPRRQSCGSRAVRGIRRRRSTAAEGQPHRPGEVTTGVLPCFLLGGDAASESAASTASPNWPVVASPP